MKDLAFVLQDIFFFFLVLCFVISYDLGSFLSSSDHCGTDLCFLLFIS